MSSADNAGSKQIIAADHARSVSMAWLEVWTKRPNENRMSIAFSAERISGMICAIQSRLARASSGSARPAWPSKHQRAPTTVGLLPRAPAEAAVRQLTLATGGMGHVWAARALAQLVARCVSAPPDHGQGKRRVTPAGFAPSRTHGVARCRSPSGVRALYSRFILDADSKGTYPGNSAATQTRASFTLL
jgi:hypothetical protein